MRNWLKPYLAFCRLAFNEEYKPVRGYRPLRILYLLIGFIVAEVLNLFFGLNLWQLIKPVKELLSNSTWIIIGLGLAIFFLLSVIDGARRYHERTVGELKADSESRAENIERLSKVVGRGEQIQLLFSRDSESAPKMLPRWAELVDRELILCYGMSGGRMFADDKSYAFTIPEDESQRRDWLDSTLYRLSDLIEREHPPSDAIQPRRHIPSEAYKV